MQVLHARERLRGCGPADHRISLYRVAL